MHPENTIYHNLPQPDYGEFVGREEELAQIFKLLRPYPQSRHHLIVIDGIGGIGKSTLALEVAHRCLQTSMQAKSQEDGGDSGYLTLLRQILIERFSEDELQTLCFDMALDYEMLPGQGKGGKARELVAYLSRRNRLDELTDSIHQARPDIFLLKQASEQTENLLDAEIFDAIIWVSAKNRILTSEGILSRHQIIQTLDDIYATIAVTLQRKDIQQAKSNDRSGMVRQALTKQRTLLLVDNLETLEDEGVYSFLKELPAPTKAVITTRHRLDVAYPVRLKGMPWESAASLISRECTRKDIALTTEETQHLVNLTGGIPLAIVWSIGKAARGLPISSILEQLYNAQGDISEFCFADSLETIRNTPAYTLLIALSVFPEDASRNALIFVTELPNYQRDSGLEILEILSLINRQQDRFSMLPLTRTFITSEFIKEPQLQELYFHKAAQFFCKWLSENRKGRSKNIYKILPEMENILGILEWTYLNDEELFADIVGDMDYYLSILGDWVNRGKYLILAIEITDKLERTQDKARFLRLLAGLNHFQGDIELALKHTDESFAICTRLDNKMDLTLVHLRFAAIYRETKMFPKSYFHLTKALKFAQELDNRGLINRVYTVFVSIEIDQENFEKARELFQLIEEGPDKLNWRTSWQSRQAGEIAMGLGDLEEAERRFIDALEQGKRIVNSPLDGNNSSHGSLQNIAEAEQCLALLFFEMGKTNQAEEYARNAIKHFSQLGMSKNVLEIKSFYKIIQSIRFKIFHFEYG